MLSGEWAFNISLMLFLNFSGDVVCLLNALANVVMIDLCSEMNAQLARLPEVHHTHDSIALTYDETWPT